MNVAAGDQPGVGSKRMGHYKTKTTAESEAQRRRAALAAQQLEARANRIDNVRRIALDALISSDSGGGADALVDVASESEEEEQGGGATGTHGSADCRMADADDSADAKCQRLRRLHRTCFFARQMQMPDWMTEVPTDLATSWLLLLKPEGDRCLLLSDGGKVQILRKNGQLHEKYHDSRLPRGLTILEVVCVEGPQAAASGGQVEAKNLPTEGSLGAAVVPLAQEENMADAALSAMDQKRRSGHRGRGGRDRLKGDIKYAVCDVLIWDDTDLASAEAECRMFWLESRFADIPERCSHRARPLQLVRAVPASQQALQEAYHDNSCVKDSLLFLHRQSQYVISEPVTPLALMWRDKHISRWVIDTQDKTGETMPDKQAVVLELRKGGYLRTADRVVVAQLVGTELAIAEKLRPSSQGNQRMLLRCEVEDVVLSEHLLLGVRVVAHVGARSRIWADSWNRVAFQYFHRKGDVAAISFEALFRAAGGAVLSG
eukprot:TRINITY_DN44896_c0_g1_i1.p1 TRINITY_DN44896_c0_g1~~TRINITY_DN44896_c0_g1_i1.p1  ORF type:complete len:489 (+),score=81.69 TRINITY_DN44896_c0_g1_i1:153-1619(+)